MELLCWLGHLRYLDKLCSLEVNADGQRVSAVIVLVDRPVEAGTQKILISQKVLEKETTSLVGMVYG